jgi:hypothetical protein
MLKINHPGAIVRDRQKAVTPWENVRLYKYSNGVELQILVGSLPHGEVQSALSSNRALTVSTVGTEAVIDFGSEAVELVDFLNGQRPTGATTGAIILDSCRFLPSVKVAVKSGDQSAELATDGAILVATFADGSRVEVEPHGGHGHVHATRGGKPLKLFFNGSDNTLYVLGEDDTPDAHDHDHAGHDHGHEGHHH